VKVTNLITVDFTENLRFAKLMSEAINLAK